MEQQLAPVGAGDAERLTSPEQEALEKVLVALCQPLGTPSVERLTGSLPVELGKAARRMVLAAFRSS